MKQDELERMFRLEASHWWYRSQRAFLKRRLRPHLPPGSAVLDLGCGSGRTLKYLEEQLGVRGYGVDSSALAVALAREAGLPAVQEDLTTFLRSGAGPFDAVLMLDSFYFVPQAKRKETALDALRNLSAGGLLVMHLPCGKSFGREHDITVGIGERFELAEMVRFLGSLGREGLKVNCRRRISLLSAGILLRRAWQAAFPSAEDRSDLFPLPAWLNRTLLGLQKLEDLAPPLPWGSSLYVEVRVPN
jgi:SAM-dependent methyltransferase